MTVVVIRTLLLVAFLLICSHKSYCQTVRIPITVAEDGYLYLDGKANGKPVKLLLDTGCSPALILKKQTRKVLNYSDKAGEVPSSVFVEGKFVDKLTASIKTDSAPFAMSQSAQDFIISANLDSVRTVINFDGIVGMAWFEGYAIVIDCKARVLTLHKNEDNISLSGIGYLTSARFDLGVPEAALDIGDGKKKIGRVYFMIDTGLNGVRLDSDVLSILEKEQLESTTAFNATSRYKTVPYKIKKMTISIFDLNDFTATQSTKKNQNLLGMFFLSKFQIYISADRKTVGFFVPLPPP